MFVSVVVEFPEVVVCILIGVFQEFERIVEKFKLKRDDIMNFVGSTQTDSDGKVPRPIYYGGYLGGHCVVPALMKLQEYCEFHIFKEVLKSNECRLKEVGENWHP